MPDIVLTESELEALSRCSGVAVKAYLRLRARMDFDSGLVGHRSGMSYQALREWTEEAIEKGAGEVILQPSLKNVRTAVDQLVRRGLLTRLKTERLVFRCVLARTGDVRSNRTRHEPGRAKQPEPGTEPGTNPAGAMPCVAGVSGFIDAEPGTEPGTNPAGQNSPNPAHIRYPLTASTTQAASTDSNVDAPEAGLRAAVHQLAAGMTAPAVVTGPVQQAAGIVGVLHRRGARMNAHNPLVLAWVRDGIPEATIFRAMDVALDRRSEAAVHQPVNAGYLDKIIRDLWDRERNPRPAPWWSSDAMADAKARELGIATARMGEDRAAFHARIKAALPRDQGVA